MHHAYVYEGSQDLLESLAAQVREQFAFIKENDPDVHVLGWEKFGIDEARSLQQQATLKSISGRALFVLGIASITTEAQQALLKLFEEPSAGTIFVLLVPHGILLATLRSRMQKYQEKQKSAAGHLGSSQRDPQQISAFLKASAKERSEQIATLLKDEDNQKERVREFLNALEQELYKKINKDKAVKEALEDIAKVRSYMSDRSPALKMLLEHLAVALPVV